MRRTLAKLFAAATILGVGFAYAASPRISAADFANDPAKVAALQKGVAAMRANDTAH